MLHALHISSCLILKEYQPRRNLSTLVARQCMTVPAVPIRRPLSSQHRTANWRLFPASSRSTYNSSNGFKEFVYTDDEYRVWVIGFYSAGGEGGLKGYNRYWQLRWEDVAINGLLHEPATSQQTSDKYPEIVLKKHWLQQAKQVLTRFKASAHSLCPQTSAICPSVHKRKATDWKYFYRNRVGGGGADGIHLARNTDRQRALTDTVITLLVP
jgi:hypothetical protein